MNVPNGGASSRSHVVDHSVRGEPPPPLAAGMTASREPARKAGLSCAECRRSKLKCDRVFPCQSCIRRGCANICPDGALSATKGNKVLMARADKLSQQVKTMSARIRQLEAALAEAQTTKDGRHPLLDAAVKGEDMEEDMLLSEPESDAGSSEHYEVQSSEREVSAMDANNLGLPADIISLASAFPIGVTNSPVRKSVFLQFIPSRPRAADLAEIYHQYCSWMYQPVTQIEFVHILDAIFDTPSGQPCLDNIHPHTLSVFFMFMCIGSCYDTSIDASPTVAERYHALARASLSYVSVINERSCSTVQALLLLNLYKFISPLPSTEWRWLMSGITSRVAQAMALHSETQATIGGLGEEELQQRRVVFWELFVFESWTGILGGRPPIFNLRHTSSRFPEDRESVIVNGESEISFHSWKYRFAVGCMTLVAQHVFSTRTPSYEQLLELDAKLRKFPIPSHLRVPTEEPPTPWSDKPHEAMQQNIVYVMLEGTLLYLHRSYVATMSSQVPSNKFARSLWAVYRSSMRIIGGLRSLYQRHPEMTGKMFYFWSAYYSACMAIGSLIIERPECKFACQGLADLESAVIFYIEGARSHIPSTKAWTILEKLLTRAREAVAKHRVTGVPDEEEEEPVDPDFEQFRNLADGYDHATSSAALNAAVHALAAPSPNLSSPVSLHPAPPGPLPPSQLPPAQTSLRPPHPASAAREENPFPVYGQYAPAGVENAGSMSSPSSYMPYVATPGGHPQQSPALQHQQHHAAAGGGGAGMMFSLVNQHEWAPAPVAAQGYDPRVHGVPSANGSGGHQQHQQHQQMGPYAGVGEGPRAEAWNHYLSQHLGFPYVGWG